MRLREEIHWRYLRLSRPVRRVAKRIIRRLRYGPVPSKGWGEGWRVLVFRYGRKPAQELHVLAPVKGLEFDWEVMRPYTQRHKPWPAYAHEPGVLTGVMGGAGHHIFVTAEGDGNERIQSDELIPGELKGGVTKDILLVAVRQPNSSLAGER